MSIGCTNMADHARMEDDCVVIVESEDECFIEISSDEDDGEDSDDVRVIGTRRTCGTSPALGLRLSDGVKCRDEPKSHTDRGTQTDIITVQPVVGSRSTNRRYNLRHPIEDGDLSNAKGYDSVTHAEPTGTNTAFSATGKPRQCQGESQSQYAPQNQAGAQPHVISYSQDEKEQVVQDQSSPVVRQPSLDGLNKENLFIVNDNNRNTRKKTNIMTTATLTPLSRRPLPKWPAHVHSPIPSEKLKLSNEKNRSQSNDCEMIEKFSKFTPSSPIIFIDVSEVEGATAADISNHDASNRRHQTTNVCKGNCVHSRRNCGVLPPMVDGDYSNKRTYCEFGKERRSLSTEQHNSDISADKQRHVSLPVASANLTLNSSVTSKVKVKHITSNHGNSQTVWSKCHQNRTLVVRLERIDEIMSNQTDRINYYTLMQRLERLRSLCRSARDFRVSDASKPRLAIELSDNVETLGKRDKCKHNFLDNPSGPTLPQKRPRVQSIDLTSDTSGSDDDIICLDDDVIILVTNSDDSDVEEEETILSGSNLVRSDSLEPIELYRDGKPLSTWVERTNCKTSSVTDNVQLSAPPQLRTTLSESSVESIKPDRNGEMVLDKHHSRLTSRNSNNNSRDTQSESHFSKGINNNHRCVKLLERRGRIVNCKSKNVLKIQNVRKRSALVPTKCSQKHSACLSGTEEHPANRQQTCSILTVGEQLSQRNACIRANAEHPALSGMSCFCQSAQIFSERYKNAIDACKEENSSSVEHASTLTCDFTTPYRSPGRDDIKFIIEEVLLKSRNEVRTNRAYAVLKQIQALHAPFTELPFDWNFLVNLVDSLHLKEKTQDLSCLKLTNRLIALNYMISMLESELIGHSFQFQKEVNKSLIYHWCSVENQFAHVKKVIQWLGDAVEFVEYNCNELTSKLYRLNHYDKYEQDHPKFLKTGSSNKLLHLIQRLLELSVVVCLDPLAAAIRLTSELVGLYSILPNLAAKRLLLDSMTSPLLRVKLTQRLLDDYCKNDMVPLNLSGPITLTDILSHYFNIQPLEETLTPPPSPTSDSDTDNPDMSLTDPCMSSECCEELLLLISTLVESYLTFSAGKLHHCVSKQLLCQDRVLSLEDQKTLQLLLGYVDDLKERLSQQCTTQLSHCSQLYLTRLNCLASLATDYL